MSLVSILAAFGAGVFATIVGSLPTFIMVGVIAIAGAAVSMAGGADLIVGYVAFGNFFGPHVAFTPALIATAYAANVLGKNQARLTTSGSVDAYPITNPTDLTVSMNTTKDCRVLLVGGFSAILGFLIQYLYANVLKLQTDTVAMTVVTLGIIGRFAVGKSGLFGNAPQKKFISTGNELVFNILIGVCVSILISYLGQSMIDAGVSPELMASYPTLCFGISAVTLIFAQTGKDVPGTHHITIVAANALILSGNPLIGVLFGTISAIIGDIAGNSVNSNVDSHIDPPAMAIFISMFILNFIF